MNGGITLSSTNNISRALIVWQLDEGIYCREFIRRKTEDEEVFTQRVAWEEREIEQAARLLQIDHLLTNIRTEYGD